ncbi:cation:proton antiporter [Candidatus Woesearchaeota archaeon]|nr:cation:proton antiporter [Candidatus Woesearchaeota archaeon]
MVNGVLLDIAVMISIATAGAYLLGLMRQPLIPAYIITGLLIGPYGLGLVTDIETIQIFSEIGIAFLLFVVGLELDFSRIKTIGLVSSVGGTIITLLSFCGGLLIALHLGFRSLPAAYIALVVAFSSTLVVIKLISDNREIDTLHGRIMVGILLMQDILAIVAMSVLSSIETFTPTLLLISLIEGIGLIVLALIGSKYIFPSVFKFAATSKELLFLVSITVCFLAALLSVHLGFSIAIGGFVAGLALANLPYNFQIISRVIPLRDFFATLFFVSLGAELMLPSVRQVIVPVAFLFGFVVLIRPIISIIFTNFFGYPTKVSFLSAVSLTQISEFGLIIVAQGLILGHVTQEIFTITVLLALVTMTTSAYAIRYDNALYKLLAYPLKLFEKIGRERHIGYQAEEKKYDVILVGCDRLGYSILKTLQKIKKKVFVIDFNPDILRRLINQKVPSMYGDVGDAEILERVNIKDAGMIITTFPQIDTNLFLLKQVREQNKKAVLIFTANKVDEALKLYDAGADYVILPHFLGGERVSFLLQDVSIDIKKLLEEKIKHIKELHERKGLGHEHPEKSHHRH